MRKLYSIDGMHCAACSASIERILKKQSGVKSAVVSLLSKRLTIDFDEEMINEDKIFELVNNAGFGIRQYSSNNQENEIKEKLLKTKKNKLLLSIFLLIPLMIISIGGMILIKLNVISLYESYFSLFVLLQLTFELLLIIPIIYINKDYYKSGLTSLFKFHPSMDSLVSLGSSISLLYGLYEFVLVVIAFVNKQNETIYEIAMNIYLESSATVLCFVSIGKYLEGKATNKASSYLLSLMNNSVKQAHLIEGNKIIDIDPLLLVKGDLVLIKEGEEIPADGVIIEGSGNLNESSLTGESRPIYKEVNDFVIGGSFNYEGSFTIRVTHVGDDSTLNKVASLIEEASNSKGKLAAIADKIASIFVPTIISISIVAFLIWLIASSNVTLAFKYAINVLVISCPCALGLATPVAVIVGSSEAAKDGILIKSASSFEILSKIKMICFDKTGTLTKGELKVSKFECFTANRNELLKDIASIEINSSHPLSISIINFINSLGVSYAKSDSFMNYPGKGVSDREIFIGNKKLAQEYKIDCSSIKNDAGIILYVFNKEKILGYFVIEDELKNDSLEAITNIKNLGINCSIISGDSENQVKKTANSLAIDKYHYECLPTEKIKVLQGYCNSNLTAFVGDGINDSPSLKGADVGIAIGSGTTFTLKCADVILVNNSIYDVYKAIKLSKRVSLTIKENLLWAFVYNIILVPIAAGALSFAGISLTPTFASIAMSLSSICVVLNALRIKKSKRKK